MEKRELKTRRIWKKTLLLTAFFALSLFGLRAEGVQIKFLVTPGAGIRAFSKGTAHFATFTEHTLPKGDDENGYKTYSFTAEDGATFHYVAGGGDSGFLKTAKAENTGRGGENRTITVDVDRLDPEKRVDNGFKSDNVYLNVNDAQHLVLEAGKTFKLIPTRVWQAMDGETGNYFIEPDYKVEILNGDDIVSSEWAGSPGLEYAEIKCLAPGTAVLRVTYGPLLFDYGGGDGEYYNAIDPINTGIVVVTVTNGGGSAKDSGITTNIAAREYDTVYFDKAVSNHAEYSFKPGAANGGNVSVRVHRPIHEGGAAWGSGWREGVKSADGTFTVDLYEGGNIVEISSDGAAFGEYHVINAKGIDISVTDLGDRAEISFAGIKTPLEKIAGIYNPGFPDTCYVSYETADGDEVKSEGVQYNLSEKNKLTVTIPASGGLKLTNGVINCGHMGDPLGSHRTRIGREPVYPNFEAKNVKEVYSVMPDITLDLNHEEGGSGGCDAGVLVFAGIAAFAAISGKALKSRKNRMGI